MLYFFFNDTATTEIYTLSLHDALPILAGRAAHPGRAGGRERARAGLAGRGGRGVGPVRGGRAGAGAGVPPRSEEHTAELQLRQYLVCRLLPDKKTTAA